MPPTGIGRPESQPASAPTGGSVSGKSETEIKRTRYLQWYRVERGSDATIRVLARTPFDTLGVDRPPLSVRHLIRRFNAALSQFQKQEATSREEWDRRPTPAESDPSWWAQVTLAGRII